MPKFHLTLPKFRFTPGYCFFLAFGYYSFLATLGTFELFVPHQMGLTFNSMLSHLLHGQFDVDPEAIQAEAFVRNGRTFAYFGILPALFRLPLLISRSLRTTDLTILACVLAPSLAAYFKVAMVATIQKKVPSGKLQYVFGAVIMAMVFGGPQVQFLKPSIFQEVVSWSGAIAAAYVYVVFHSLVVHKQFSSRTLALLSLLSGLCLLTRVSTGFGLYASTGLLLLVLAWKEGRRAWSAGGILLGFMIIAGIVNYGRWGNPATFIDLSLSLQMQESPIRFERLNEQGALNVRRIGFALLYYFLPINMWTRSDGRFLFHEFQTRMLDGPELPPSSFFVSDPMLMLLCILSIWLLVRFKRWGDVNLTQAAAVMAGLITPIVITCMAIGLAFRYRMEFYPLFDLVAFLGLYGLVSEYGHLGTGLAGKINNAIDYSSWVQMGTSHVLAVLYAVSPFGDPAPTTYPNGVVHKYVELFLSLIRQIGP